MGSRDGTVVRALTSHQCGPGSIPGLGVICGLSLLLVLVPAPRVFLRVLRFSSLHKNLHFQIPIRPGNSGEKSHSVDSTEIPIYHLPYSIFSGVCFKIIRDLKRGSVTGILTFSDENGAMKVSCKKNNSRTPRERNQLNF